MPKKIRIVLFSEVNSKLGSPFLRILSAHPMVDLVGVVTSPPNAKCSYFIHDKCSVDIEDEAKSLKIPIFRPASVNSLTMEETLKDLYADYFIVANFQQLIKENLLKIPKIMPINFHPSPLPKYAGLAPFYWIVKNGEKTTSVSAIKMDNGLDTGDIIMQNTVEIGNKTTGIELRTNQEQQNVLMLLDLIPKLFSKNISLIPQNMSDRSYFSRINENEYKLDLTAGAQNIEQHIRAAYRSPGAYFFSSQGEKIIVLQAEITPFFCKSKQPGDLIFKNDSVYLATNDKWLRLLTVEYQNEEIQAIESPVLLQYKINQNQEVNYADLSA